jgi:hypothetical protein
MDLVSIDQIPEDRRSFDLHLDRKTENLLGAFSRKLGKMYFFATVSC